MYGLDVVVGVAMGIFDGCRDRCMVLLYGMGIGMYWIGVGISVWDGCRDGCRDWCMGSV